MNTDRVLNITKNEKGQMYAMAQRQQLYVEYLLQHEHNGKMSAHDQSEILKWAKTRMTMQDMFNSHRQKL